MVEERMELEHVFFNRFRCQVELIRRKCQSLHCRAERKRSAGALLGSCRHDVTEPLQPRQLATAMLYCRLGCVLEPNAHTEYSSTPLRLLLLPLPLLLPYFVLCTLYFVLCTLYFDEEEKMMPWGGSLDCLEESSGGGM